MLAKFSLFIVLLIAFTTVACAQRLIDVTDKPDMQIDIEFVGKPGKLKKYLIDNGGKPIEPPIPNTYQVFEKKYYKIETDIIAYDGPIFTFKALANQEDFKKIRILHLTPQELNPNGLEWQDCTIIPDILVDPSEERYSASYNERLKKFLPDFSQKTVSCELKMPMKSEEFFVVTSQTQARTAEPFTKLTWNLESKELSSQNGGIIYMLTFTNAGTKDIAEFNFRSVFDANTKLNSSKPSQGTCRPSTYGLGAVVCHVGKISSGKTVILELEGENSRLGGEPVVPDKKNKNWSIFGFFKESPNDPNGSANVIGFEPISNTDLIQKSKSSK